MLAADGFQYVRRVYFESKIHNKLNCIDLDFKNQNVQNELQ